MISNLGDVIPDIFQEGEPVFITEENTWSKFKILFDDFRFLRRFSYNWKREFPDRSHIKLEELIPKVGEEKSQRDHRQDH